MGVIGRLCSAGQFHRQLEESRTRLFRVAFSWCNDADLADDLTQEALARALRARGQLRDGAALRTWLFKILNNCWRDWLRQRRDTTDIDSVVLRDDRTPERIHATATLVERVRVAVSELPQGQRQALTLVDLEGFTYAEVAEALEIPIGTVMSRICRARRALGDALAELGPGARTVPLRRVK